MNDKEVKALNDKVSLMSEGEKLDFLKRLQADRDKAVKEELAKLNIK